MIFSLSSVSLFALSALLARAAECRPSCLTEVEASKIVADFTKSFLNPSDVAFARSILAEEFTGISDSANFFYQKPLNTTLAHSPEELVSQVAASPPVPGVKDLFIGHNCETITWYYEFEMDPLPVRGIAILFVNEERKIFKTYREINIGALMANVGYPECDKEKFKVPAVGSDGVQLGNSGCGGSCGLSPKLSV